jgi:hypothetical protein
MAGAPQVERWRISRAHRRAGGELILAANGVAENLRTMKAMCARCGAIKRNDYFILVSWQKREPIFQPGQTFGREMPSLASL